MVWLKGKAQVRVQEIKLFPEADDARVVLQAPSDFRKRLWLTLRGGEDGAECFELVHEPDRDRTPYGDLVACGRMPDGMKHARSLIGQAEAFSTRWGVPLLPPGFFQTWVFREIYCFPLDEFRRMARLVSALDLLLEARFVNRKGALWHVLTSLAEMPRAAIIPWDGKWPQPGVLRGGTSRVWQYQTPATPLPTAAWLPEFTVQFSSSHIPAAYLRDPYNPIRLLPYRLGKLRPSLVLGPPLRSLPEMQEYCDRIRLGVKAYVVSQSQQASPWSFILEEWVQRYDRRNGTAYCCYTDGENRPCGSPLPLSAPSNRRYCDEHREERARQHKRATAEKRRGRSR